MKITKKILTALGSGAILIGSSAIIASCSCSQKSHIEAGETNVDIVGNQKYNYFIFTLNDSLSEDQQLTCDAVGNDYFTFGDLVIENKLVSLPVVWKSQTAIESKTYSQDIKFTCKNSDGSTAWEQTIAGCSVNYSPNIYLSSSSSIVTETLSDDKQTLTGEFKFKLGTKLESILELKPYITNIAEGYSVDADNTKIEVNGTDVTLTLVVNRDTTIGTGDKFTFDLQIECVVTGTVWTYWQSNMFSNMSMSYEEKEIAIDEADLDYDTTTDPSTGLEYSILKGVKSSSKAWEANANYNTLIIPAKSAKLWIRQIGYGTDPITLPNTIKKIKIGGIGVQTFSANCFYGMTNIKYFDVSCITDSVQSLDTLLKFGTNALGGWNQSGHIIWNAELSQYKKHLVKEKMYYAGLTNKDWFGIIKVTNISQLKEAAFMGGTIELQNDITITPDTDFTGQINFYDSCILDLNGHSIEVKTRPIFNTPMAEFAVIGVWDCELLVCDSSANHDGSIKAFDCSAVHDESITEAKRPTEPPQDPSKDPGTNIYWEWLPDDQKWRIRENRTFYVRSDIPSRAKGSLEILGGKFYGNCTTCFNYNTTIYVEDGYVQDDQKTKETYKGTYAPEFHLYSVYCTEAHQYLPTQSCQEMLNCKESTCLTGEATFQVWGGKFYGAKAYNSISEPEVYYDYFDPSESYADIVPDSTTESGYNYADWTNKGEYSTISRDYAESDVTKPVGYILAIPSEF